MPESPSPLDQHPLVAEWSARRRSAPSVEEAVAPAGAIRTPRRRRRLRVLLIINALLAGVYAISQLSPETVKKLGPAGEYVYNLVHPSADPEEISPAGKQFIAEIRARGGTAVVTGMAPGFLGIFPRSELFHVRFYRAEFKDGDLAEIVKNDGNRISGLDLRNTRITDDGLRHLEGLSQLHQLVLGNDGSRLIRGASFPFSPITDAGLVHLKGLNQLIMLNLSDLPITDAGLLPLNNLPQLSGLYLSRTNVHGPGLVGLKSLRSLTVLYLDGSELTDEGLNYLAGAANLQMLSVSQIPLTAKGLQALKLLPKLNTVELTGTGLLDEEVRDLKKSIPGLKVMRY